MLMLFSKGIHGVTRETGERINTLPHMLSDMDKPYGLVALPNGCAEGELTFFRHASILKIL